MHLITQMLMVPWDGKHTCQEDEEVTDCSFCEVAALWHQLAMQALEFVAPKVELRIPEKDLPKVEELQHRQLSENRGKHIRL